MSNGFFMLSDAEYIVVTNHNSSALRDWIRALGANQITVLRLEGEWGTFENRELGTWLQSAANFF
jgi:hypothetical protein